YASRLASGTVAEPSPASVPVTTKDSGPALARAVAKDLIIRIEVGGLSLSRGLPTLAPAILQRIDGRRSIAAIEAELRQANPSLTSERFAQDFAQLYAVLNGFTLLLLRAAPA
ncbi:MAG TPA: hypothetical protein VJL84_00130, partial [Kiloniellales bacterium]|nr:hypothetical protein [Kiloniellales bacterium]